MKILCFIFMFFCLSLNTIKGQNSSVEHFTVNNIIYVKELDGKSLSLAEWDWKDSAPKGHIDIPATVFYKNKNYIVESIQSSAFYDCSEITSITIPPTVKSIGAYAFRGCNRIEAIKIPSSVKEIGDGAFEFCFSLKSIVLPDSIKYIEDGAFYGCPFTSITIPNSVVGIGAGAFDGCEKLENITLSNSLQTIGIRAFDGCKQLSYISLPASVTLIGKEAFHDCSNLTSLYSLKEKKQIDINSIYDYYQIFHYYDSPMRAIMLRIIEEGNSLQVCGVAEEFRSYYIPSELYEEPDMYEHPDDSVKILVVSSISDNAFSNNNKMEEIYIPASINKIGENAFSGCTNLKNIYVPEGSINHFKGLLSISLSSKLKEVDFSNINYYQIANNKPIKPHVEKIIIEDCSTEVFD